MRPAPDAVEHDVMGWQLVPGAGFCEVGGELIFLDLARDKYLALRGGDRAAFERLRSGEPSDSDAMTRLVGTGLLARSDGRTQIEPTSVDVPSRDLSAMEVDGLGLGMALSAARALHWARGAMRPLRIAATLGMLRQSKSRLNLSESEESPADVAARYAACRWLNPTKPRCLVDALALDRILLSRGHRVAFVFGVGTAPFRAHCWLQTPTRVLTGTAAEARNFSPILVIA